MHDKIENETQNLSIEQLQQRTDAERAQLSQRIDRLGQTEQAFVDAKNYNNNRKETGLSAGFGTHYNTDAEALHQQALSAQDEQILVRVERENARKEEELARREAELRERENKYAQDKDTFLDAHPGQEEKLQQKEQELMANHEAPASVTIPAPTTSQDMQTRKENAMARQDALRKKEEELNDREFLLGQRTGDLAFAKAEALTPEGEKLDKKARKLAKRQDKKPKEDLMAQHQQAMSDTPTPASVDNHVQQQAGFKGDYFDAGVEVHTQAAQLGNIHTATQTQQQTQAAQLGNVHTATESETQTEPTAAKLKIQPQTNQPTPTAPEQPASEATVRSIDSNTLLQMMQRQRQNQ